MRLLIGAAVGTLFLVPAYGLAQADVFRLDPCDPTIIYMSRVGGLISCAETGHAPDQYNLGVIYAEGNGVPEDYGEAVRWYRLAAEQGHASAQNNLGLMYTEGNGVPEDDAEAVRWYRLAAEQGDALAQTNLGFMYGNGDGVPRDLVFAYTWFNLSAAQGNETAQRNNEMIEQIMTREEISEAQRLSREWIEAHPPGGN
jgi:TPR repeat protein